MLEPLATLARANDLGYSPSAELIARASVRVRGYLRQTITADTSTVTARGPVFRLPQRPVRSVDSVLDADGTPIEFSVSGSLVTVGSLDEVTVAYSHGYELVPDELVDVVCQVANRLSVSAPELEQGVQQQSAGPWQASMGWDAWKALSGLTSGEKQVLDRYYPVLPGIVTVGRPA